MITPEMQRYFTKKLLTNVMPLLKMDAFSNGWEYETHVCKCCGHETYTHISGTGKPLEWPKGSIKFRKPSPEHKEATNG